jgi:hypothetical protein
MNKIKLKNQLKKWAIFLLMRAFEFTALYFFTGFVFGNFEGWHAWAIWGAVFAVYLITVFGTYASDYHERHRYDDVVL